MYTTESYHLRISLDATARLPTRRAFPALPRLSTGISNRSSSTWAAAHPRVCDAWEPEDEKISLDQLRDYSGVPYTFLSPHDGLGSHATLTLH